MNDEREQFILKEDAELKRIKERKMQEFMAQKREKAASNSGPVHVTDADFDKVTHEHPLAIIDCWAPWCGPCRSIAPTIEEIAREFGGKVFVGKLNVDENPKTSGSYQVQSIPTLLIMKNGCEVDRIIGLCPKEQITGKLMKHLG
jgi:thioredoxin